MIQKNISTTLQVCKNTFTIFSTNRQSINAKIVELRLSIEHLKTFNFMLSVICIQESWLSEGADTSLIHGKSYSSKRGVIIYLNENVNYKLKLNLFKYTIWEGQCVEIMRGKRLSKPLY